MIVLDVKGKQEPAFALDYGNYLEPFSLFDYVKAHKDKTKLSIYELRIMSRSIILDYLKSEHLVLQAISEMPKMQPAIYCSQNDEAIAIIDSIHVNGEKINTYYDDYIYKVLSIKGYRILEISVNIISSDEKSTKDGQINPISRGDKCDIVLNTVSEIKKYDFTSAANPLHDDELNDSDMKYTNKQKSLIERIKSYFYKSR